MAPQANEPQRRSGRLVHGSFKTTWLGREVAARRRIASQVGRARRFGSGFGSALRALGVSEQLAGRSPAKPFANALDGVLVEPRPEARAQEQMPVRVVKSSI